MVAAREALCRGDATAAREVLLPLLDAGPPGECIELAARAHYIDRDFPMSIEQYERAYARYRAEGDHVGAVRVARTLAPLYSTIMGDWAIGNGWLSRAQTVLSGAEESSERGWVALDLGMFEGDRAEKHNRFQEALDIAIFITATWRSNCRPWPTSERAGCTPATSRRACGCSTRRSPRWLPGRSRTFCVLEEVFCQLFSACEHATDVARADQWISVGEAIADARGLPTVSAFCRTHYGGVLTAAGRCGARRTRR